MHTWIRCLRRAVLLAATALLARDAISQERQTQVKLSQISVRRTHDPITLDGLSYEAAWQGVVPLPVTQHLPAFGSQPSERTEILISYDDDNLYVAGRLYDSEPARILATSLKRDSDSPANDWFGVIIDSFNDKENAVGFFTTPTGLRWDGVTSHDAEGTSPVDISWNTSWDVAVVRNDSGWFVEMRIPFSSLRFQLQGSRLVMGLISWRYIARKSERVIFPAIPPNWGHYSIWKPSQAQEVVLESVRSDTPLYVSPYLLAGLQRTQVLDDAMKAYRPIDDARREAGLDVKYGLTSNLTLDVTVNPDFAQVEADDQQVNLTRFPLFFPEKRSFFLERASTFDFGFDDRNRLFYSRRIGLHDGRPIRIYGGARVVGRVGSWDVGVLDMQTAPAEDRPSENLGVFRLRRSVFNPFSYAGVIATTRVGADGSYNIANGLDGLLRLFGDEYLTLKLAQTFQDDRERQLFSLAPLRIWMNWERRIFSGLSYVLDYSRSGAAYDPGMGFEVRRDYTRLGGRAQYGWIAGAGSPLLRSQVSLEGTSVRGNANGLTETSELGPRFEFTTTAMYYGEFSVKRLYERVTHSFKLSDDVEVPIGEYNFYGLEGWFNSPRQRPLSGHVTFDVGSFYDGRRLSAGVGSVWRMSSNLELTGSYERNRITFARRAQALTGTIGRVRALLMLNTTSSMAAFLQFNSLGSTVIGNVRFRYNPREGVDLYLVYDEGLNTDRDRTVPVLPLINNRTVMVKYTHPFPM